MVVLAFSGDIVNALMVPELSESDGGENDGFVYASIVMSKNDFFLINIIQVFKHVKVYIYFDSHDSRKKEHPKTSCCSQ
jgi:hypothetical protein